MKPDLKCLFLILMLTACAGMPISEQIAGKSDAERSADLLKVCADESWRGHDSGSHRRYRNRPENKTHAAEVVRICKSLAEARSDRVVLRENCLREAAVGTYQNLYQFDEHVRRLTEICDAF